MLPPDALLLAGLRGLVATPGRSVLAGLGIAIGTCSLSLLLALSTAVQRAVADRLDDLGGRQFIVRAAAAAEPSGRRLVLSDDDATALAGAPGLAGAAPAAVRESLVATPRAARRQGVTGTTAAMFALRRWHVVAGRPLIERDLARHAAVAVVGPDVAATFFEGDPIGRTLRVDGLAFEVVGVTAGNGLDLDGTESRRQVLVPLARLPRDEGVDRREASYLTVESGPSTPPETAIASIGEALQAARGPGFDASRLHIVNLAAVGEAARGVGDALATAFLLVALIALGVGGIGIMNVMLAGAAERVREVGVRLAIGAAPVDIFLEFLVEALALCVAAGLAGEALAWAAARAIAATGTFAVSITAGNASGCIGVAAAIGTVFGLHPARRAAGVAPTEALRAL
jgi:putative ABC transport system permease protein